MAQRNVRVFLIAPALTLWGLDRLVRGAPDISVADSRFSLDGAITTLETTLPDVVVLDADDVHDVGLIRRAYERTRVKIVALVSRNNAAVTQELRAAGVSAAVEKRASPSTLLRTIEMVSAGGAPLGAAQEAVEPASVRPGHTPPANQHSIEGLTARERETISAVAADPTVPLKVIADRLHIAEHTLRNHLTTIYSKLGVTGRVHLHDFAARHHLVAVSARPQGPNLTLW